MCVWGGLRVITYLYNKMHIAHGTIFRYRTFKSACLLQIKTIGHLESFTIQGALYGAHTLAFRILYAGNFKTQIFVNVFSVTYIFCNC
jgi:hypothetical protein